MIIGHIYSAFLHKWNPSRTDAEMADVMRQELAETYPIVTWQDTNSIAYAFIQSLCKMAKESGLSPGQFTPGEIYLDALCKVDNAMSAGVS